MGQDFRINELSFLYVQYCPQRDTTGIGGSWSEFLAYVAASIQSEETKLGFEGKSEVDGEYFINSSFLVVTCKTFQQNSIFSAQCV